MEKSQYDLCIEVLRRLNRAGVLSGTILIGSWCIPLYKEYFFKERNLPSIKTRDLDFLVPAPRKIQVHVDIPELLKGLGFVVDFSGSQGYIRLEHPELIIEFLVPEQGKGSDKPYPLPQLGLNAQALRFLDLLAQKTVQCNVEGIPVTLPHPANFSIQKLIVSQRRTKKEKMAKDKEAGVAILKVLIENGQRRRVKEVFDSLPQKWQKKIIKELEETRERELVEALRPTRSSRME